MHSLHLPLKLTLTLILLLPLCFGMKNQQSVLDCNQQSILFLEEFLL